jgi:hypothetical protein
MLDLPARAIFYYLPAGKMKKTCSGGRYKLQLFTYFFDPVSDTGFQKKLILTIEIGE